MKANARRMLAVAAVVLAASACGCSGLVRLDVLHPERVPKGAVVQFRPPFPVYSILGFSPDGSYIVFKSRLPEGLGVAVWDIENERTILTVPGLGKLTDNGLLIVGDGSNITVFDLKRSSARYLLRWHEPHHFEIEALAVSANSGLIAAGVWSGVRIGSLKSGRLVHTFAVDGYPGLLEFSPDGKTLVAIAQSGAIRVWDMGERKLVRTIRIEKGLWKNPIFSHTGRTLLITRRVQLPSHGRSRSALKSRRETVLVDLDTGEVLLRLSGIAGVLGNGRFLIQPGRTPKAQKSLVYDMETGKQIETIPGMPLLDWRFAGRVAGSGSIYVTAGGMKGDSKLALRFWDLAAGTDEERRFLDDQWRFRGLSRDGKTLCLTWGSVRLALFDRASSRKLLVLEAWPKSRGWRSRFGHKIVWSPDGRKLATHVIHSVVVVVDLNKLLEDEEGEER